MNKLFSRLLFSFAVSFSIFALLSAAQAQPSAPSNGAGSTFLVTITEGGYGYGKAGRFILTLGSNPAEYKSIGLSNVPDSGGAYSYSASGAEGKVTINDVVMTFTFNSANSGSYSLVRGGTALNGYQRGHFVFYNGTVPASLGNKIINYVGSRGDTANIPVNYRLGMQSDHAYVRLDGSQIVNSYLKEPLSSSAVRMYFNDAVRGRGIDHLVFATTNSGLFVYKIGDGKAYEIGSFWLEEATLPVITTHPKSSSPAYGTFVTLQGGATGVGPFTYQWMKTGVPIPGATQPTLTLGPITSSSEGRYRLQVSNFRGSVLTVAGVITPTCETAIDQRFVVIDSHGGPVYLNVTTPKGDCDWRVQTPDPWVTSDSSNESTVGPAKVTFMVEQNTSAASRVTHTKVGNQVFRIFQEGTYAPDQLTGLVLRLNDEVESSTPPVRYFSAFTTNLLSRTWTSDTITNLLYTFQKTGSSTAQVQISNTVETINLAFTSHTTGSFTYSSTAHGERSGTFTLTQNRTDHNEDGRSDLIWQHVSGRVGISYMYGPDTPSTTFSGSVERPTRVVGVGDLNRDGFLDTLRMNTNRTLMVDRNARLKEGVLSQTVTLRNGVMVSLDWNTVAVQDMDQDGNNDLLFQHRDGRIAYWRMNGLNFTNSFSPRNGTSAGFGWRAAGAADMNGDRVPDIIFQNSINGLVAVWYMLGGDMVNADLVYQAKEEDGVIVKYLTFANGPNWRLRAIADMDYDGHNDFVWQKITDGTLRVWLMKGLEKVAEYDLLEPMDPGVRTDPEDWILIGPK